MGDNKRTVKAVTGAVSGASKNTFTPLARMFQQSGRAQNLSKNTLDVRDTTYDKFMRWMELNDRPLAVERITREDIQDFLHWLRESGMSDNTVRTRYLNLHVLFDWLVVEGEISRSPCERMKTPKVDEKVTPLLTDEEVQRLLKACDGKDFDSRRDKAMILLLLDTGMRRGELVGMTFETLHVDEQSITVHNKRLERIVAFGNNAALALNRYLMARMKHKYAHLDAVWLTTQGAMYKRTVNFIIERRAKQAGLEHVWPHLMRHQFSHLWLEAGGQERSLMQLNGWKSSAMLGRYGASLAAQRARDEHKKLSPGDRFK